MYMHLLSNLINIYTHRLTVPMVECLFHIGAMGLDELGETREKFLKRVTGKKRDLNMDGSHDLETL